MKKDIVEALEESKEIDRVKENNNRGRVISTISIFSAIYGIYFWSSLFLPKKQKEGIAIHGGDEFRLIY